MELSSNIFPRLDDLEDGSPLRRGKPSTHNVYGEAQTINSATYQYTLATVAAASLGPACLSIFVEDVNDLYIGQSHDLYWTHNVLTPSIADYFKMVDMKTGGLFRMLTRLMLELSAVKDASAVAQLDRFGRLIGRYFQLRDDYQNLQSADYAKQKGFAEDLDEGKYSFMLIHCIQALEADPRLAGDRMQLRSLLLKRRVEGKLSLEAKKEILATMKKTRSLEYSLVVLRKLHEELSRAVSGLDKHFGQENLELRLMLELLKV